MFQFAVSHLVSVFFGALLGITVLWATRRVGATAAATTEPSSDTTPGHVLRAELQLATQTAGIGVWRMDIATGRITSDSTLRRILGIEQEMADGMLPVHPDDRQRTQEALLKALRSTGDVVPLRTRIVQPDGQVRHIQTHFRKIREHGSGTGELLGVSRDVTDEVIQRLAARVRHSR